MESLIKTAAKSAVARRVGIVVVGTGLLLAFISITEKLFSKLIVSSLGSYINILNFVEIIAIYKMAIIFIIAVMAIIKRNERLTLLVLALVGLIMAYEFFDYEYTIISVLIGDCNFGINLNWVLGLFPITFIIAIMIIGVMKMRKK